MKISKKSKFISSVLAATLIFSSTQVLSFADGFAQT